jgi:putative tryptophan/tyrosine transport system substrate-binding protein
MFKVLRRLWLGLTLIIATSGFLLMSDWKQRAAGPSKIPKIAIFTFSSLKVLDDGIRGVTERLKDNGYIHGQTAIIQMFNAENDMATANSIAKQITTGEYGYVISISTNCLQAVAGANREGKAKHIFGVVADPSVAKVGVSATDPMDHPKHMVGIGTLMPPKEILAAVVKFNPRAKKFGLPWNPSQANSEKFTKMARAAVQEMGLELLEAAVDNTAAVGETVSSLVARGADAILVLGDVTVALAIDAVVAEARKGKIPVISMLPDTVARGALYGAGPDFYDVGKQMGDLTTRVLKGEDTAKIPILYDLPITSAVNMTSLPGLKDTWTFPSDVLAKAKVYK